jgi:spermidine/putrescine transport system permease protein
MPGVIAATLIVLIPTVGDFITPRLVGGTDGLMIANMIQIQVGRANNAPLGAALAISSMVVVGTLSVLIFLVGRRFGGRTR